MERIELLRQTFTKDQRLIEIGASYNPVIPKREGWHTTIIDHADQASLIRKYQSLKDSVFPVTNIEPVDYVWNDGSLADAVPTDLHGTFDGLIASHVGEHMPDLIGFFNATAKLLRPFGTVMLALPDKRLCFDFFHPSTTTGELLEARGRTRHTLGTLYDHVGMLAERGGVQGWLSDTEIKPFNLVNQFNDARGTLALELNGEYRDAHAWHFTPASFQLLVLDLNLLRLIPWAIARIEPAAGVEFYIWLERRILNLSDAEINQRRLELMRETLMETKMQLAQMEPPPPPQIIEVPVEIPVVPAPIEPEEPRTPSIAAIIPLYNGAKFIEDALRSVLAQTLPPNEIIVVDDGSTDNGAEIVQMLAKEYPITLLSKPNGGQSSARNFGIHHSTSELIALLDQDDMWYPQHLDRLVQPFMDDPMGAELGWVYSDLDEVDTDGLMICHRFLRTLGTPHPKRNLFECLREDMFILPSASLIRRTAFLTVHGFDERLSGYEDDDLFLRLFRAGYSNVFLEEPLSKWRIYPESTSYTYRMRRSRSIYANKLWTMFKDDPKRARYLRRDLIVPRFYGHAVVEYRDALMSGDGERIDETHAELTFWVEQMPQKKKQLGRALVAVRSQRAAKFAYAARHFTRPIVHRLFFK